MKLVKDRYGVSSLGHYVRQSARHIDGDVGRALHAFEPDRRRSLLNRSVRKYATHRNLTRNGLGKRQRGVIVRRRAAQDVRCKGDVAGLGGPFTGKPFGMVEQ